MSIVDGHCQLTTFVQSSGLRCLVRQVPYLRLVVVKIQLVVFRFTAWVVVPEVRVVAVCRVSEVKWSGSSGAVVPRDGLVAQAGDEHREVAGLGGAGAGHRDFHSAGGVHVLLIRLAAISPKSSRAIWVPIRCGDFVP